MRDLLVLGAFSPIFIMGLYACYVWGWCAGSKYTENAYRPFLKKQRK